MMTTGRTCAPAPEEDVLPTPTLVLPEPLHVWPPHITAGLWRRVLRMTADTLQTRAGYHAPGPSGLTRWPHPEITFDDYEQWRSHGDRQRRPTTTRDDSPLTATEKAQRKTERENRSRQMREVHENVCTALVALAIGGWDLLVIDNREGIHIALDILDGVRCQIDHAGFVVENGDGPMLITSEQLPAEDRDQVRSLARGTPPHHLHRLGHYGMGELLNTGANYLASWTYLQQPGTPDPHSPTGRAILRQRFPQALLTDELSAKACQLLSRAVAERRREATARLEHYQRTRHQPPASHRYA